MNEFDINAIEPNALTQFEGTHTVQPYIPMYDIPLEDDYWDPYLNNL